MTYPFPFPVIIPSMSFHIDRSPYLLELEPKYNCTVFFKSVV